MFFELVQAEEILKQNCKNQVSEMSFVWAFLCSDLIRYTLNLRQMLVTNISMTEVTI